MSVSITYPAGEAARDGTGDDLTDEIGVVLVDGIGEGISDIRGDTIGGDAGNIICEFTGVGIGDAIGDVIGDAIGDEDEIITRKESTMISATEPNISKNDKTGLSFGDCSTLPGSGIDSEMNQVDTLCIAF